MRPPPAPALMSPARAGLPRWVRAVSEQELLVAAQRTVALRYGVAPPPLPRGAGRLWQQLYAPVFHRLPYPLRAAVANRLPGSHRQTWHPCVRASGPAV